MSNKVMGVVYAIVSVLVLSIFLPLQFTGMTTITSGNLTNLTGLSSFVGLAPILVLLLALFETGIISFQGFTGSKMGTKQIINVVSAQVVLYVGIILFPTIVTQFNSLWTSAGATAQGFVGICPLLLFIGLILGTGWWSVTSSGGYRTYKTWRARRRSRHAYAR